MNIIASKFKVMQKLKDTFLLLLVVFSVGCGKDDTDNLNADIPKCLITEWKYIDFPSEYSGVYEYDNQKKLIKVRNLENGSPENVLDFTYNSDGRISKTSWSNQQGVYEYTIWEYNSAGLRSKESLYNGSSLESWITYEYDAGKKLIKRNVYNPNSPNAPLLFFTYTYLGTDRVVIRRYEVSGGTPTFAGSTEYFYDNQKRPLRFGGAYEAYELVSAHNIVKEKIANSDSSRIDSAMYIYQYNPDGFPVEKQTSQNGSPFIVTQKMTYNCQ